MMKAYGVDGREEEEKEEEEDSVVIDSLLVNGEIT